MPDRPITHSGGTDGERITRIEERLDHGNRTHLEFRERLKEHSDAFKELAQKELEQTQDQATKREDRNRTYLGWVLGFIGVIAAWAYSVTSKPDEARVRQICQTESPYLRDQSQIQRVIERYDSDTDATRSALEAIRLQLADQGNKLDVLVRAVSQPTRRRRQP